MRRDLFAFAEGLIDIVHEPDSDDAIAAASLVAHLLVMQIRILETKFQKSPRG